MRLCGRTVHAGVGCVSGCRPGIKDELEYLVSLTRAEVSVRNGTAEGTAGLEDSQHRISDNTELAEVSSTHLCIYSDEMGDGSWVVQDIKSRLLSLVGQRNAIVLWDAYHLYTHLFSKTLYNTTLTLSLDFCLHQWTWLVLLMQPF